ncbi:NEL-type E3 ubiquitin ligase domain-containing protein [Pseudomonas sp. LB3P31]
MSSSSQIDVAGDVPESNDKGIHFELIKNLIPGCLVAASPSRRKVLKDTRPDLPDWYEKCSAEEQAQLKALLEADCHAQNQWDKVLNDVQSITTYAKPLLTAALAEAGVVLDVENTWLRLYYPVEYKFFGLPVGINTSGFRSRTFSLLQAALHNFEAFEAEPDYFDGESLFITEPDVRGHFDVIRPALLSVHQFVAICRKLDIGGQYEKHIKDALYGPGGKFEPFRQPFIDCKKAAIKAATYAALLKKDIERKHYDLLVELINDNPVVKDEDIRRLISYSPLRLMGYEIAECALFFPTHQNRYDGGYVIVYIPDDPEHPIKKYGSFAEFEEELTHKLMHRPQGSRIDSGKDALTDYQRFFSRFVSEQDRGRFFLRFSEKVKDFPPGAYWANELRAHLKYLEPASRLVGPLVDRHWRRDPLENIDLHMQISLNSQWRGMSGIWIEMYRQNRRHILENAQVLAVSTVAEDNLTRERRLSNYLNIGMFIVGIAAFFVPPAGAAMLLITANQLLFETIEGIREISRGDKEAGWAHITDVVENLATMAELAPIFHYAVSPFIEGLKAVTLPSGKVRLWKPDLRPYQLDIELPEGSRPNERGLHRHDGRNVLPLDGDHYAVQEVAGTGRYRVQHPTRPDAYAPELNTNGSGAWNHEAEHPQGWDQKTVLRRLGHSVDAFSDTELEHIRIVSDTDEDLLRRMHVDSEPMPELLADTIKRFNDHADAKSLPRQISEGKLRGDLCDYAASLMAELPGWPGDKVIEVMSKTDFGSVSVVYGPPKVTASGIIQVNRSALMAGQLPRLVMESFNETQVKSLLGQHPPQTLEARIEALQGKLADRAKMAGMRIFESLYSDRSPEGNRNVQLVKRNFSGLTTRLATTLLADATPVELAQMSRTGRVPLRLGETARRLQQKVRLARAYEGLYLEGLAGPDTESLVLHSLEKLPGWAGDLSIEVRQGVFSGELRARVGAADAPLRKVLVHTEDGQYEARDAEDNHLHGSDNLYAALQHALPDEARRALGLPHIAQGTELGQRIRQHLLTRDQLRSVLKMQSIRKPFFKPLSVLPDGRRGYPLSGRGLGFWGKTIETRIKALYPDLSISELNDFAESLNAQDSSPDQQLLQLEREYTNLDRTLKDWLKAPNEWSGTRDSPQFITEWSARIKIVKALKEAWQKTGPKDYDAYGNYRGQSIDLTDTSLQWQLRSLPELEAKFDHVTRLRLSRTGFGNEVEGFLGHFRQLRALNLSGNQLIRLPSAMHDMPHLLELHLGNNRIVLTAEAVESIKNLTQLKILGLENNPLALLPDVSRMPNLYVLNLSNTGLDTWPGGIFSLPRPRHFDLRLMDNPIERIPVVAPGSFRAEILARTSISREPQWLSAENLQAFKTYIESVGLDPDRRFPSSVISDSRFWVSTLPAEQRATPGQRTLKRDLWRAVADEFGSEAFFNEIRKLEHSADASDAFKSDLGSKVWRMLDAMAGNSQLREKLFTMAGAPTTCVDAGAQLFNAMGVEVLVQEAYELISKDLVEAELVTLARGRSRLDELAKIARGRVAELQSQGRRFPEYDADGDPIIRRDEEGNSVRSIDEVEIHLAYATDLAARLDLPWQSRNMMFREPDVTPIMIEAAFNRVLALEQGDLLRDSIIEQEFWTTYIRGANRSLFKDFQRRADAALDLQIAGKMTEEKYAAELVLIDAEEKSLLKRLTQEAMGRAKLQRRYPS